DVIKKHLRNADLQIIWNTIKDNDSLSNSNPWIILATKGLDGAFKNSEVFSGLCEIMCQVSKRKEENKTTNNLRYSNEFTNFLVILGSISPRALDLFRQNLAGRSIQSIR